jgi:hypothetical protein
MSGDPEHDDDFEAYLDRRVSINKGAHPKDSLEPPPELDRLIIGKARKAIQTPAPIRMYRAPKWALPVGLAATILLSFAVLLNMGIREKHQMLEVARPEAPVPAAAPSSVAKEPAVQMADATRVPPIATAPWPVAHAASKSAPTAAPQMNTVEKARTRLARAEAAAIRSRKNAETLLAGGPPLLAQAESSNIAAKSAVTEPVSPITSPDADDVGTAASSEISEAVVTAQVRTKGSHPEPAAWLTRIEKLRKEGQTAPAEREMRRFRSIYPSYPLPAEASESDDRRGGQSQ